jgi:hypothetical protein
MTGCGANLINVPSLTMPNSACSAPPRRMTEMRRRAPTGFRRRLFGMNQAVNQNAEKESRVDPWCIDRRRLVAEHDADDGHDQRGRQSGNRAIGKVILI